MYQVIHRDFKCSKCKAVNDFETVTVTVGWPRISETFKRCRACGHEGESRSTWGETETNQTTKWISFVKDEETF